MPAQTLVRKSHAPRVDPEFQSLIAPLTPEERRQLEDNIVAGGCRDALVTWKETLLDGHNRLEICTRLHISFRTCEIELANREAAKLWIEENQLGRRNLTQDQRAAVAFRVLQRRVAISKRERARKGGFVGGSGRPKISLVVHGATKQKHPRLRELAAAQHGVSTKKIREITRIAKTAPAIVAQIIAGTLTLKNAKKQLLEDVRQTRRQDALKTNARGERIHTGDVTLLHRLLPDNSVDLFLTDPPFDEMSLFGKLAELAQAKLKPGGFCLLYCGSMNLPQILTEMTRYVDYYWLLAVTHDGGNLARVWSRKMIQHFSPVLMFVKRPAPKKLSHEWCSDLVRGKQDKSHHRWGKSDSELEYWIEHLTLPNQLVVDPFCGGGAVPVACITTNRRCIGTEIDPGVAAAARARIAAFRKGKRTE